MVCKWKTKDQEIRAPMQHESNAYESCKYSMDDCLRKALNQRKSLASMYAKSLFPMD